MPVLETLLYFSVFNYPVTKDEIFNFSKVASLEEVDKQLEYLLNKGVIFQFGLYFSVINNIQDVNRRELGNKKAKAILPKAKKVSKFISKFPYVENVSISGALSKGYYDDEGDFDFFIITTPNKLWIARTLLIIFKKIFLLNSKKYFCVNYFISSNHLNIPERNRFTATEITTLIPVYGKAPFSKFIQENNWAKNEFPNKKIVNSETIEAIKKPIITKCIERVFNTHFGDLLDDTFRKMTLKKWKINFNHMSEEDFKIAMKSTKNVSKHHPQHFQKKVINELEYAYNDITQKYNLEYV
ncbi:nucleotidyltransferase domain-containing protein [uncultured Lacinutrix sp.]|uniref:nucleotidyltransferase domain-containing protein n=1 Tax=uncultured Lacinutrix sp. TaxID=574032 RepID=UPI00260B33C0|nr:nucleotidyltransferase domain-containing protein [uncultured Lacinutrix sp.]